MINREVTYTLPRIFIMLSLNVIDSISSNKKFNFLNLSNVNNWGEIFLSVSYTQQASEMPVDCCLDLIYRRSARSKQIFNKIIIACQEKDE